MRLYTVSWQGRRLICLQTGADRLAPLPYETMNHLLADDPAHRQQVLDQAAKGPGGIALSTVRVLAPLPQPRQDVICLGMNYQKHKTCLLYTSDAADEL